MHTEMTGNATLATPKPAAAPRGRKPATKRGGKRKSAKSQSQPSRTKTPMGQGIYIPASRVKYCLDTIGLNKSIEDAINELREAEPHTVKIMREEVNENTGKTRRVDTGKTQTTDLVPWDKLSESTRTMVGHARTANDEREKKAAESERALAKRLAAMSADERRVYDEKQVKSASAAEAATAAKVAERTARAAKLAEDIKAGRASAKKHPVRGEKKTTKYSNEIELLSKLRVRFAKDASQQAAATLCALVHERVEFAMKNCKAQGFAIVKERHAITEGHDNLPFAPLIRNLPAYKAAIDNEKARVVDEARKVEEKKAAKKAKKEAALEETTPAAPAAPAAPAVAPEEHEDDEDEDEASFGHYVRQVCHNIMNEKLKTYVPEKKSDRHPYEDIRISLEFREWMSDIIVEFTRRFCPLLNGQIRAQGIKTISRDTIRETVNILLNFAGADTAKANALFDQKFAQYQEYSKTRKVAKAAAALEKEAARKKAAEEAAAAGKPAPEDEPETADESEPETDDEEDEEEAAAPAAPVVEEVAAPVARKRNTKA